MRSKFLSALLLPVLLLGVGCAASGTINASAVSGTFNRVADRHDAYVNADTNITPLDKSVALRDTALLRATIKQALPSTQPAAAVK